MRILPAIQLAEGMIAAVRYELLDKWKITEEQAFKEAMKNAEKMRPAEHRSLNQVFAAIGFPVVGMQPDDSLFKVLTSGENGASCLFYDGMMERISQMYGGDYVLIPSSIHEFLTMPYPQEAPITRILREINRAVLEPGDFLSDNAYRYNSKEKKLEIL